MSPSMSYANSPRIRARYRADSSPYSTFLSSTYEGPDNLPRASSDISFFSSVKLGDSSTEIEMRLQEPSTSLKTLPKYELGFVGFPMMSRRDASLVVMLPRPSMISPVRPAASSPIARIRPWRPWNALSSLFSGGRRPCASVCPDSYERHLASDVM